MSVEKYFVFILLLLFKRKNMQSLIYILSDGERVKVQSNDSVINQMFLDMKAQKCISNVSKDYSIVHFTHCDTQKNIFFLKTQG